MFDLNLNRDSKMYTISLHHCIIIKKIIIMCFIINQKINNKTNDTKAISMFPLTESLIVAEISA